MLTPKLGQTVAVENRPGGSGTIGVTAVTQAARDGYTLGAVAVNSLSIHPYLFARLTYDPKRDLLPVSLAWEAPLVLVVPAAHVPARSVNELVVWARQQRRGVACGSSGVGTTVHLSGELFCRRAGMEAVHVPFRGGAEAASVPCPRPRGYGGGKCAKAAPIGGDIAKNIRQWCPEEAIPDAAIAVTCGFSMIVDGASWCKLALVAPSQRHTFRQNQAAPRRLERRPGEGPRWAAQRQSGWLAASIRMIGAAVSRGRA